ncbi:MAG: RluA family pseudouridine synthase [Lachnospiraceae bacterium]|nr:RluA family pseudouridine synthase [Lachnospiraceae bacterium]
MKRIVNYEITPSENGMTIAYFLRQQGYTRKSISTLKKQEGAFSINGNCVSAGTCLKEGTTLIVTIFETATSENIEAENLPLKILYEDEDILVVDKPAGMAIHPSINHHYGTLANSVMGYYNRQGIKYVFRCLNRLDRDTSGVVILAKHMLAGAIMSKAVKNGLFHKEYMAVVSGCVKGMGIINAPIGRVEGSIIERQIDLIKGKDAITHYETIKSGDKYSLLKIVLETGRTHQIRVHMKHIGHPLPGDFLYNPDFRDISRQALHCYKIGFEHPITKEQMEFVSELPEDMKRLMAD